MTRRTRSPAGSLLELAVLVVVALGCAYLVQAFLVKPYRIPSASMEPTLPVGERILVDRIGLHLSAPKVGDIMVFHPPVDEESCAGTGQGPAGTHSGAQRACDTVGAREAGVTFVKRVVGLPGDHLQIHDGHVIRNGRRETDPYAVACTDDAVCDFPGTIVVPKGDYYMMGDNRPDSEDSRFWGPVPRSWLIGYVFFSYWPLSRFGTV